MNATNKLMAAALAVLPGIAMAQPTAHYAPGVEGIKGASLPPPGFYVKDYNAFYFANRINDSAGNQVVDPGLFIYAQIPRVVWITEQKVLGGNLGVDALIPLQYTDVGIMEKSRFGIGDLFAEATLSWHTQQADFSLAAGAWMPTGESSTSDPTKAGAGFWTPMFTAGVTWYPDADKKWALSALSRYEINTEKEDTNWTPGNAYTLEWGLSYGVTKTIDVGVVGYYQQQVTNDSPGGSVKDKVVAIGPEILLVCPKHALFASVRYNYEVLAEDRAQGHTVALTLTKKI